MPDRLSNRGAKEKDVGFDLLSNNLTRARALVRRGDWLISRGSTCANLSFSSCQTEFAR